MSGTVSRRRRTPPKASRGDSSWSKAYRQKYGFNAIYLLPVNLFGPGDNVDPRGSRVFPALIEKFVDTIEKRADHIDVWGTGAASREFSYVDDAAEGIVLATEKFDSPDPINLGTGREITIWEIVELTAEVTGFKAYIRWVPTRPWGQPTGALDTSRAREALGFVSRTSLADGIRATPRTFRESRAQQSP